MCKIIIVDDEKMIRMGISQVIPWDSIGITEVYLAASGNEAMKIIQDKKPEIMLTDINMTEMTGLDLIEEAVKIVDDMRILVLTGYDNFEYARACLRMNVQDFHLKPVDEEVLADSIRDQVEAVKESKKREETILLRQRTQGSVQQIELESIMRNFITNVGNQDEINKICEKYGYKENQNLQIAIFLPKLCQEMEQSDGEFMLLSIKNICIGLVDANEKGITFVDEAGRIVIALFSQHGDTSGAEEMSRIINILRDEFETVPRVVLGSVVTGYKNLYISYNDAQHILDHEKKEDEAIMLPSLEKKREKIFQDIFEEFRRAICNNIRDGEYVLHVFERYEGATKSYNLSDSYAAKCCFELAASAYYCYLDYTGEAADNKLFSLTQTLLHASADEACEMTRTFLWQLVNPEEKDTHEIIQKAKRYIEENLADEISVSSIAAELYITANYFSRLFKRVQGEGCNEYIVRKRIEKAKSLLEMTSLKTGKIAFMVGYHDTNYFSLAFKKHTGISPSRYRDTIQ